MRRILSFSFTLCALFAISVFSVLENANAKPKCQTNISPCNSLNAGAACDACIICENRGGQADIIIDSGGNPVGVACRGIKYFGKGGIKDKEKHTKNTAKK